MTTNEQRQWLGEATRRYYNDPELYACARLVAELCAADDARAGGLTEEERRVALWAAAVALAVGDRLPVAADSPTPEGGSLRVRTRVGEPPPAVPLYGSEVDFCDQPTDLPAFRVRYLTDGTLSVIAPDGVALAVTANTRNVFVLGRSES